MRDPQHLERNYHGHKIISIQNMEPVEKSDGWTHAVYDENKTLSGTFETLGAAIQCAKRAKHEAVAVDVDGSIKPIEDLSYEPEETETDLPETEENE